MQVITQQFSDQDRFLNLLYVVLLTLLSFQCLISTVAIVFRRRLNLTIMAFSVLILLMLLFNNCSLKIDPDNNLFVLISQLSVFHYNYFLMIIIIYGLGRCPPDYHSKPLIEYELDENTIYHVYFKRFSVYVIISLLIEILVFIICVYKPSFKLPRIQHGNQKQNRTILELNKKDQGDVSNIGDRRVFVFWIVLGSTDALKMRFQSFYMKWEFPNKCFGRKSFI